MVCVRWPDHRRHLVAGHHAVHRPLDDPGGQGREHRVGPRGPFEPNPPPDVLGDDPDVVRRQPEGGGQHRLGAGDALVGVLEGEPVAVPLGDRGVGLHRVVVLGGVS